MGLDARTNRNLAQALLLFRPTHSLAAEGRGNMEVLITAKTAEIFYDQLKLFTRNLLDINRIDGGKAAPRLGEKDSTHKVKVSLVECVDWYHVFAFLNTPGEVKAQVDDVAKTFILA